MSTRHSNPNMVVAVDEGIARAEALLAEDPAEAARVYAVHVDAAEELLALLQPKGDRPIVVAAFLKAKHMAHCQGYIAAYRSSSENH